MKSSSSGLQTLLAPTVLEKQVCELGAYPNLWLKRVRGFCLRHRG